jgi:hypothetical protein
VGQNEPRADNDGKTQQHCRGHGKSILAGFHNFNFDKFILQTNSKKTGSPCFCEFMIQRFCDHLMSIDEIIFSTSPVTPTALLPYPANT